MIVCRTCGRALCHDGKQCAACRGNGQTPSALVVPYSFKLLLQVCFFFVVWAGGSRQAFKGPPSRRCASSQEMSAMGIDWRLEVQ